MFGLFDSSEKKLQMRFQEIGNKITNSGGALNVCKKFGDWFIENELRKIIGVVPESQSPFSKPEIMMAALLLLDSARDAKTDKSLDEKTISTYAESAYVASAFLIEDDVLLPLLKQMQLTGIKPLKILEKYSELHDRHKEAWHKFVNSDIDLKKYILSIV